MNNGAKLGDIATRVTRRMRREHDLRDIALGGAAQAYLSICAAIPHTALQKMTAEIPFVQGQDTYDITSYNVAGIFSIRVTASGRTYRARRSHHRVMDTFPASSQGNPILYSRFNYNLEWRPVPSSSATSFRIRYWDIPVFDDDNIETIAAQPIELDKSWNELIYYETLYRVFIDTNQMEKAQMLMMPSPVPRQPTFKKVRMVEMGIIPRLWNDLLLTVQDREGADESFSINPIGREYNAK